MSSQIIVRAEKPREQAASSDIIRAAFGREREVCLVAALRKTQEYNPEYSIVAERNKELLGYALFSDTLIEMKEGIERAVVLSPICVKPDAQRQGIGERLVRHGLERCRGKGIEFIFVSGLPRFFSRFGFKPARPLGLVPGIPIKDEDFQAIDLSGQKLGKIFGKVVYPAPFGV